MNQPKIQNVGYCWNVRNCIGRNLSTFNSPERKDYHLKCNHGMHISHNWKTGFVTAPLKYNFKSSNIEFLMAFFTVLHYIDLEQYIFGVSARFPALKYNPKYTASWGIKINLLKGLKFSTKFSIWMDRAVKFTRGTDFQMSTNFNASSTLFYRKCDNSLTCKQTPIAKVFLAISLRLKYLLWSVILWILCITKQLDISWIGEKAVCRKIYVFFVAKKGLENFQKF